MLHTDKRLSAMITDNGRDGRTSVHADLTHPIYEQLFSLRHRPVISLTRIRLNYPQTDGPTRAPLADGSCWRNRRLQPKSAFWRSPSVHRADLGGPVRVDSGRARANS